MANVLDIKRRIRSVINTRQITKAMKMVSAAKLRRAQERALASRPYAQMLTNVLKSLVTRAEIYDPDTGEPRHPLLAQREEKHALLIVVTGDKGLAGAFNTNILKTAMQAIDLMASRGASLEIEAIGRKGRDFLKRRFPTAEPRTIETPDSAPRTTLIGEKIGVLNKVEYSLADEIAKRAIERYTRGEIDSVYILYNEFKSVIQQRLVVEVVLPIARIGTIDVQQAQEQSERQKLEAKKAAISAGVGMRPSTDKEAEEKASKFGSEQVDYIYEQPPDELFRALLPKYVGIQIFHALLESVAAEHAARMTAMEAATSNATDMINSLTLVMNRARQAKITKEIIEIVSGAAAG
jgi:F-type H+-transporting ATPase subunit gamma